MIRIIWTSGLAVLTAVTLVACGGGGTAGDTAGQKTGTAVNETAAGQEPAADRTPAMDTETESPAADTAEENTGAPASKYQMSYDPNAVYTAADITMRGSYLKIDLEGLTDAQMNRVIHRLRSEFCTCGCENDPIDQCLVNDPACTTAVTLAKQIIREERTKS